MKVVVASTNPAKVQAVTDAFARQFPGHDLLVEPLNVASGVSDQPIGDEETRRGAMNRAENASRLAPDADYWVGLEGGIEAVGDELMAYAWMVVRGPQQRLGSARTVTLPLPRAVKDLVDRGLELGEANDEVFGNTNSKRQKLVMKRTTL